MSVRRNTLVTTSCVCLWCTTQVKAGCAASHMLVVKAVLVPASVARVWPLLDTME